MSIENILTLAQAQRIHQFYSALTEDDKNIHEKSDLLSEHGFVPENSFHQKLLITLYIPSLLILMEVSVLY